MAQKATEILRQEFEHESLAFLENLLMFIKDAAAGKDGTRAKFSIYQAFSDQILVTRRMMEDELDRYIAAADFVEHVKGLIVLYGPDCVLNAN
ncbi:hypothetical protein BV898_17066 [Hypsibius exemplaris]|uniref:Uncharacterized protein n=1 Tax=Hypsibius exemplaris TaxID=2072580 RepID=A0A9X6NGJ5_HYPEX|nr:hypothetical protein BV898_17066 [Hypsibius exemplaris]